MIRSDTQGRLASLDDLFPGKVRPRRRREGLPALAGAWGSASPDAAPVLLREQPILRKDKLSRLRAARAEAAGREYTGGARRFISRAAPRVYREIASAKNGVKEPCESAIEYDHCVVLDARPDVLSFRTQPETWRLLGPDGRMHRYYPDVRVDMIDGRIEYHEVKDDDEAEEPELQAWLATIQAVASAHGLTYRVVLASEIRREPRLSNSRKLRTHRIRPVQRSMLRMVRGRLVSGDATVAELVDLLRPSGGCTADVMAMALHGYVALDLDSAALGPGSVARLPLA